MTKLLKKAFKQASNLPQIEQNAPAKRLLEELETGGEWDRLFAESEEVLGRLADEALEAHRKGKTKPLDVAGQAL